MLKDSEQIILETKAKNENNDTSSKRRFKVVITVVTKT